MSIFNTMLAAVRTVGSDEKGVTAVEYGVIASVIVVACLVAFQLVGTNLNTLLASISGAL